MFEDKIGNTPILKLERFMQKKGLNCNLYAKLESKNLTGSIKDRIAYQMIITAQKEGILLPGATIIEPTSGNTGIGLSAIGTKMGYRVIICMSEAMSVERRELIKSYGGEVVLTKASEGMLGAIKKAKELKNEIPNSWIPMQFENPANPIAHHNTAKEILNDLPDVDIIICGIGTGGTITGLGQYFEKVNKNVKLIGVEPAESPFLKEGYSGSHQIQGIGAGFKPDILDLRYVSDLILVKSADAINMAREIFETEKIAVGISSGAALVASLQYAKTDAKVLVILPDDGNRYQSILNNKI